MTTEDLWTCGHTASAACAECYRLLALRAHELVEENLRLVNKLQALAALHGEPDREKLLGNSAFTHAMKKDTT